MCPDTPQTRRSQALSQVHDGITSASLSGSTAEYIRILYAFFRSMRTGRGFSHLHSYHGITYTYRFVVRTRRPAAIVSVGASVLV